MEVLIRNQQRKTALSVPLLRSWAERLLQNLRCPQAELSILLVSDRKMRGLNRQWRGIDRPTDVLSFPLQEGEVSLPFGQALGDIVISLETAQRQAVELGHTLEDEVQRLLIHGLLHLLGYDHTDPEPRRRMRHCERRLELFLKKL